MTTSFVSSDLLQRLRRSVLLSGVLFLSLTAGICGDDDDDDGGTGPSADCIDEFIAILEANGADEDDVESISLNGSESGSLSNGDIEDDEGFLADAYVLELNQDTDIEISLNPSGFDAVLILFGEGSTSPDVADSEDPEATEEIAGSAAEGCYLIVVTSFEAEETGSYSLSVDEID